MEQESKHNEFQHAIADFIVSLVDGVQHQQVLEAIEFPKKEGIADYALCVPRLNKFVKLKGKPIDIAKAWAEKFEPTDLLKEASSSGPYLNFVINKTILARRILPQVFEQKEKWGCSKDGEGKTIIVEFSSPNIAKPFHYGHLRSTIIGNFLKNIHIALGYNVVSINYLGDWGKQYGLLAVGYDKYGSEEELLNDPIRHLYNVYVAINKDAKNTENGDKVHDEARAYFKRMEDGDEAALALWKRFRDLSVEEYKALYQRLNVGFDVYSGESMFGEGMKQVVEEMCQKNIATESEGALVCDLKPHKINPVVVRKRDGTTLYITRDIAAAKSRYEEYKFDKMFYVVGAQQNLHFQQLFKILELMGYDWASKCEHINFGMIQGMSTRSGTVTFLSDILQDAKEEMLTKMESNKEKLALIEDAKYTADIVGISALVVQDFSARRIRDYAFDLDRSTTSEGDTGPYLQYAHARLCSMERKTEIPINVDADLSLLTENEATDLVNKIARFPEIVKLAARLTEACTLVSYLMDLCHSISTAHHVLWVKGREKDIAEARMFLFWAARITLGNGLRILGLTPLQRM